MWVWGYVYLSHRQGREASSDNLKGTTEMNTISDKVRQLVNYEGDVEPGFNIGAGLRITLDSTGDGFVVMREDHTIVLELPGQTGMLSVTTADLRQQEKAAITRVVRGARPHFTPDWQLWNAMRKRSKGIYTLLPVKHFI
nr:MAG TPA: hypothetical protein [Caudoviricetes sp.]